MLAFTFAFSIIEWLQPILFTSFTVTENTQTQTMKPTPRETVQRIKGMFDHSYDPYMELAYPSDEIGPLSCTPKKPLPQTKKKGAKLGYEATLWYMQYLYLVYGILMIKEKGRIRSHYD